MSDEAPKSITHTYPDGSQRVGVPPFPKTSPIEDAAGVVATAPIEAPSNMVTANHVEVRASVADAAEPVAKRTYTKKR